MLLPSRKQTGRHIVISIRILPASWHPLLDRALTKSKTFAVAQNRCGLVSHRTSHREKTSRPRFEGATAASSSSCCSTVTPNGEPCPAPHHRKGKRIVLPPWIWSDGPKAHHQSQRTACQPGDKKKAIREPASLCIPLDFVTRTSLLRGYSQRPIRNTKGSISPRRDHCAQTAIRLSSFSPGGLSS